MKIFQSLSIGFFLCLSACEQRGEPTKRASDYLIFGTYYGMCYDDCTTLIKIENGNAYVDDIDYPFKKMRAGKGPFYYPPLDFIKFQKKPLSESYYNAAKTLMDNFPNAFATLDSQVFGSPDGDDGGGIYLEVRLNGERKIWTIDANKNAEIPEIVSSFRQEIRDVSSAFSKIPKAEAKP